MELLKIPGAILFTLLLIIAAHAVGDRLIHPQMIAAHAYLPPEPEVDTPYRVVDGKVDWDTYNGFRRYGGSCLQCHGPYGVGSTFAPALAESLKVMSYDDFVEVVINGRDSTQGAREGFIMPALGDDPNVVIHIDDIYAYLKGRSDGAVPPIQRLPHLPKPKKEETTEALSKIPFPELLAKADVKSGKKLLVKCKACHALEKKGPKKLGPSLWNIVGANIGGIDGYKYSDAMAKKDGDWSYEALNDFLANPKKFVPGTKMIFPGFRNPKNRADAIAFLRGLSDDPKPIP